MKKVNLIKEATFTFDESKYIHIPIETFDIMVSGAVTTPTAEKTDHTMRLFQDMKEYAIAKNNGYPLAKSCEVYVMTNGNILAYIDPSYNFNKENHNATANTKENNSTESTSAK